MSCPLVSRRKCTSIYVFPWLVKAGDLDAYHQYDGDHNHHGDCHHRSHFNRYDDNHNFRYFGKVHLKNGLLWTRKIQHVVWTISNIFSKQLKGAPESSDYLLTLGVIEDNI